MAGDGGEADRQPEQKIRLCQCALLRMQHSSRGCSWQQSLEQIEEKDQREIFAPEQSAQVGRADVSAAGRARVDSFCASDDEAERDGAKEICDGDECEEHAARHASISNRWASAVEALRAQAHFRFASVEERPVKGGEDDLR